MLDRVKHWLALTVTEQRVILFLAVAFLIGGGIRLYQEVFPAAQQFDYRSADSTFTVLSERLQSDTSEYNPSTTARLVNINTASKEELMQLPGIGAVLAERIVLFREDQGLYKTVEDLQNVKGIRGKKFQQLKPLITVR